MGTKPKKQKYSWPKIRKRGNGWLVDCAFVFGARRRKTFNDLDAAEQYAADMRAERAELRTTQSHERRNRHVTLSNLTETQRAEVIQAFELLGANCGLLDAVRFYLEHAAPHHAGTSLEDVFDAYIDSKRKSGKRPRTVRDADGKLRSFVYDNKDRPCRSITTADIERFLDGRKYEGATRDAYRRAFIAMFNWAIKRGYTDKNPAMVIERTTSDQKLPAIMSVADVKKLLKQAECAYPKMLPYIAVGIFAGLRPENELAGLSWEDIDLKEKLIRVDPATSKRRRQRYVEISANLVPWLTPHAHNAGRIFFSRRQFRALRAQAGIKWDRDIMRHTFASYHIAMHKSAATTADQLGHSGNTDVLHNHYRNLVKPADAKAFWAIKPASPGKILKLKTA